MSIACSPEDKKKQDLLNAAIDKWYDSKAIVAMSKTHSKAPAVYFKDFYRNVTDLDFDYDPLPNLKLINKFNRKVEQLDKRMKKSPNDFQKFFYLPEVLMSKNPITKGVFNSFVAAGNFFRGNTEKHSTNLDHIVRNIDLAMKQRDTSNRWGSSVKAADKIIKQMEREYQSLLTKDKLKAEKFYNDNLRKLGGDSRLEVMENAYELFTNPESIRNQDVAINKYGTALVEAASIWHNKMKDNLWEMLNDGLKHYTDVIRLTKRPEWGYEGVEKAIEKIMSEFKYEKDYFPTQLLDIFPAITKFTESLMSGKNFDSDSSKNNLNDMIKTVADNLSRPGSTLAKMEKSGRASRNVINVIDTYTKNVLRFNYMSRVTKRTIEGMKALQTMEGKDFDNHLKFMRNYLKDTHATATGINNGGKGLHSFARALTAWGFMSKLGLNFRSAARNATQSLQNYIWFGHKGIADAMKYLKSNDMKEMIETAMKDEGVFFVNIEELAGTNNMFSKTKVKDGILSFEDPSIADHINTKMESWAKTLGKPMQWVENRVNRQWTFKLAFATEYKRLMENDHIVRRKIKKRIEDNEAAEKIEKEIRNEVYKKSKTFARNLTRELHYEYSKFAKAKAVRGPIGSVLGQFTTYSMNFLNYQVKIAKAAKDPFLEGQWSSPEVRRAVRLGMTYFVMQAILQPMLNTTVSNLVQHDTQERLNHLHAWLSEDDEKKKKAFFGKGPLLGTLGGPFLSDLLNIGNIAGLIDMDEDSFMSYLGAHQDLASLSDNDKLEELVRVLNTQLHRTFYSTIPKFVNGASIPTVAGSEFGLFPDRSQSAIGKKLADSAASRIVPSPIRDYFTPRDVKEERLKRNKQFWAYNKPKNKADDLTNLLKELAEQKY